jgi:hypothetical protein
MRARFCCRFFVSGRISCNPGPIHVPFRSTVCQATGSSRPKLADPRAPFGQLVWFLAIMLLLGDDAGVEWGRHTHLFDVPTDDHSLATHWQPGCEYEKSTVVWISPHFPSTVHRKIKWQPYQRAEEVVKTWTRFISALISSQSAQYFVIQHSSAILTSGREFFIGF